jgi:hypothetical protein
VGAEGEVGADGETAAEGEWGTHASASCAWMLSSAVPSALALLVSVAAAALSTSVTCPPFSSSRLRLMEAAGCESMLE